MIEKQIYRIIRKHGTITGSRAWKVATKDSDFDYLVRPDIYAEIKKIKGVNRVIKYHKIHDPAYDGYPTFYFEYRGRTINVISPMDDEYHAWLWATYCLKEFPAKSWIKSKEHRINIFQKLRALYMTIINDIPF